MKAYRANGNGEFEIYEIQEVYDPSLVKVKISSVIPSTTDVDVYQGKFAIDYPRVPGHMATAIISEDRPEFDLKRGAKVILNPYVLSSIDKEGISEIDRYGLNSDGFLRDFTAVPIDNIIPFPEEVKENEAIFTEIIAVALATVNSFELNKGDYIAIVGNSLLTNIIAQLALYYQAVPIYIAKDARFLDLASKCGIYYTINELEEDPYRRVHTITGGRLAEHTILHAKPGSTPNFLYTLTGRGGDCIVTSINPSFCRMEADISQISNKHLVMRGISNGADEINSAVNLLAQKVLKLPHYIDKTVSFEEVPVLFKELAVNRDCYICPLIRI